MDSFSAVTLSDPEIYAAENQMSRLATHSHISKAILSHKSDLIPRTF